VLIEGSQKLFIRRPLTGWPVGHVRGSSRFRRESFQILGFELVCARFQQDRGELHGLYPNAGLFLQALRDAL
jgi:hypothetical protein